MNAHDPETHKLTQGLTGPQAVHSAAQTAVQSSAKTPQQLPSDQLNLFLSARRYSNRVRRLKVLLPVLGGLGIIAFMGFIFLKDGISTPLGVATIDLTNGEVVMDNPKLSGFTASDAGYEIVANKARQDLDNPKKVLLEKIGATLTLKDGNVVSVDANEGKFDVEGESLKLGQGVTVHMSAGYTAELEDAAIDIKDGVLSSDSPVFIKSKIGDIRANSLRVRDNGQYILFDNRVKMTIKPNQIRPKK